MRILITGASGFIGGAFTSHAAALSGTEVVAVSRKPPRLAVPGVKLVQVARYDDEKSLSVALDGVDCVVHTAARAHVLSDDTGDPLSEFRQANVAVTVGLARHAADHGVRRFVFVSSIGVNGESTIQPFTEKDAPAPLSPYAVAKYEAEQALATIASDTGIGAVVVRPPLVTGRGAPGNFGRLVRLARSGLPLPFGGIRNRRSLIGIENLCDFLAVVSRHESATNQTFLVADPQDISTSDLIATLRKSMGLPPRLVAMPPGLMRACLQAVGRGRIAQQLYGDLQVSAAKAHQRLGWTPRYDTIFGLARAVGLLPQSVAHQ